MLELDEAYLTDAAQDPHEPKWATDATIAEMQEVDDPYDTYPGTGKTPTVRTSSGGLDFIHLPEAALALFEGEASPRETSKKAKLDTVRTRELGSDKWRGRTAVVTASASAAVLENSAFRRVVKLVNQGTNIIYISSISSGPGAPNTFPLLPSTATLYVPPLELPTKDDVWAVCGAGLSSVLGIIEIFDMES